MKKNEYWMIKDKYDGEYISEPYDTKRRAEFWKDKYCGQIVVKVRIEEVKK